MQAPLSLRRLARGRRGLPFFVAVAVFGVLFWLPVPALAILLPTYDLASLVWQSDAIVRARREGSRTLEAEGFDLVSYRILKVYTGPLSEGEVIELPDDYRRIPLWGWQDGKSHVTSDEVIAFLQKARPDRPFRYNIVLSGLRVLIDGQVHRFVQENNPGNYGPVPAGPDPWDLLGDPRGSPPLDWNAFEKDLAAAQSRVARVREALKGDLATPAGKAALQGTLGPLPEDELPSWNGEAGFYDDEVAPRVIEALVQTGDSRAVLDGLARIRGSLWGTRAPAVMLVGGAKDSKLPVSLRRAALHALDSRSFDVDKGARPALLQLLSDPEPEVRKAVLKLAWLSDDSRYRDMLKKRFDAEKDTGAKVRLVQAASLRDLLGEVVKGDYMVLDAERNRLSVEATLLYPESARRTFERVVIEARKAGALAGRISLMGEAIPGAAGTTDTEMAVPLAFDPPLAAGTYDLDLTIDIGGGDHLVTRHMTLSPMKLVTPLPAPAEITRMQEALRAAAGSSSSATTGSTAPPASTSTDTVLSVPGAARSTCACRLPGALASTAPDREIALLPGILGGWLAARRRRKKPS